MTNNMKYCPYGSCYATRNDDGSVTLTSYRTKILTVTADGWVNFHYDLTCTATTRKHVGCFLKEYAPETCYMEAKFNYKNGAIGYKFK